MVVWNGAPVPGAEISYFPHQHERQRRETLTSLSWYWTRPRNVQSCQITFGHPAVLSLQCSWDSEGAIMLEEEREGGKEKTDDEELLLSALCLPTSSHPRSSRPGGMSFLLHSHAQGHQVAYLSSCQLPLLMFLMITTLHLFYQLIFGLKTMN